MSSLDASLIGGYKPIEIPDQTSMLLKAMQMQKLAGEGQLQQAQLAVHQGALARAAGLDQITRANPTATRKDLAMAYRTGGYGDDALKLEEKDSLIGQHTAAADASRAETQVKHFQITGGITAKLATKPDLNINDVAILKSVLQNKGIDTRDFDTIPPDATPDQLRGFFTQYGEGAITAADQAKQKLAQQQFGETQTHNRNTEGLTMRGQNMGDARAGQANSIQKDASRAQVIETPDGLKIVDKGTGVVRNAVNADGTPARGTADKLGESAQKQVAGIDALSAAVDEYRQELAKWKKTGALSPDARAAIGSKYNNMMLQGKEAYNLGVLNGPDYSILTSVVADPLTLKGFVTSNGALDKQASELDRMMQRTRSAVVSKGKGGGAPSAPSGGGAKFLGFE